MADEETTTSDETTAMGAALQAATTPDEPAPAKKAAADAPSAEANAADADAAEAPAAEGEAPAAADGDDDTSSGTSSSTSSSSSESADPEAELEAGRSVLLKPSSDARYLATGKRKTAVARVQLTPGDGTFWVNGKSLDDYFPRHALRTQVLEPLVVTGAQGTYQVRARIHGGGVSAQAHALAHGIAKALAEVHPAIRTQVKQQGMLKVDTRQVERKKAGLKKARKKPQFSKR